MRSVKLRRNSKYRHIFKPDVIYYYDIDKFNIHNNISYSHIIYRDNNKNKKSYMMAFTEYNFDRCFCDVIRDRRKKLKQLFNAN